MYVCICICIHIYIYIYIYITRTDSQLICPKNTPPEKEALGKIGFRSHSSGGGEQFLLLDCRAAACIRKRSAIFTKTGNAVMNAVEGLPWVLSSESSEERRRSKKMSCCATWACQTN